jgi:succinyl-diaminopimelate desuccinylase
MNAVELTRDLIRFNTINPPGDERACAQHLARLLEPAGFTVASYDFAPGRTSLVARSAGASGQPALCFTGHIDVVPLGAAPWSRDAFAGEVHDGKLYGRGSSDMKSGVAAFVAAALRVGPKLRATPGLVLVITAGEETACQGAAHLAGVPNALGSAGAMVVAEPTGNAPCVGHKGALWLEARTAGVTAHGSMPERGVNAIYKAARAALALEAFRFDIAPHPVLGAPTLNLGTIKGGLNVNSVPDAATLGIDIRTIPEQKQPDLVERLSSVLRGDVVLTTVAGADGIWTDPDQPWVQQVFEVAERIAGIRPGVRTAPYFTDASSLTPAYGGVPTVILGPGETALAHQTDEYCLTERIEQAVEIYVDVARRWCGI